MHEEMRVWIDYPNYHKAFSEWTRTNKVKIKDKNKFFLAKLKYEL